MQLINESFAHHLTLTVVALLNPHDDDDDDVKDLWSFIPRHDDNIPVNSFPCRQCESCAAVKLYGKFIVGVEYFAVQF